MDLPLSPQEDAAILQYCMAVLTPVYKRLNFRRWRIPLLPPFYDMMSDALVWADEVWGLSGEIPSALRPLFYYRTGLILGVPRAHANCWEWGRKRFPCWAGFHPYRCHRSRWLADIYLTGKTDTDEWIKEAE